MPTPDAMPREGGSFSEEMRAVYGSLPAGLKRKYFADRNVKLDELAESLGYETEADLISALSDGFIPEARKGIEKSMAEDAKRLAKWVAMTLEACVAKIFPDFVSRVIELSKAESRKGDFSEMESRKGEIWAQKTNIRNINNVCLLHNNSISNTVAFFIPAFYFKSCRTDKKRRQRRKSPYDVSLRYKTKGCGIGIFLGGAYGILVFVC